MHLLNLTGQQNTAIKLAKTSLTIQYNINRRTHLKLQLNIFWTKSVQSLWKNTILLSTHVRKKELNMKTHNDSAFNLQVLLLEEPNLNASFLEKKSQLEKASQIRKRTGKVSANPRRELWTEMSIGKRTYTLKEPENQVLRKPKRNEVRLKKKEKLESQKLKNK